MPIPPIWEPSDQGAYARPLQDPPVVEPGPELSQLQPAFHYEGDGCKHEKERPHRCDVRDCTVFARKDKLQSHKRSMHGGSVVN
ncbi:hypothetical protein M8818_002224 [Zalaria obscura]|uniref:Uncharacterized protein n=1 Tax=Zalaria obscura TaxID=2024903 RepID=A0ACC3SK57_9PEZI